MSRGRSVLGKCVCVKREECVRQVCVCQEGGVLLTLLDLPM